MLEHILTAWLALNAGIILGAWWATRQSDRQAIARRLRNL